MIAFRELTDVKLMYGTCEYDLNMTYSLYAICCIQIQQMDSRKVQ